MADRGNTATFERTGDPRGESPVRVWRPPATPAPESANAAVTALSPSFLVRQLLWRWQRIPHVREQFVIAREARRRAARTTVDAGRR